MLDLQGLDAVVTSVDKSHFRPMQKESFLCQARCCDTTSNQAALQAWCAFRRAHPITNHHDVRLQIMKLCKHAAHGNQSSPFLRIADLLFQSGDK